MLLHAFRNANGNINVEKLFIVEKKGTAFFVTFAEIQKPNRFVFFIQLRETKRMKRKKNTLE